MTKRLITLLAALLLLGFAVAGCGDDDGDGGGNGNGTADTATDTATTQEDTATDEAMTDETDTGDGGGVTAPGSREEAAEQCREGVASVPQLSESAKDEVRDFCDAIASGDEDEIRDAARDVCETIVDETVPEGTPGRQAALDACRRNIEQQTR